MNNLFNINSVMMLRDLCPIDRASRDSMSGHFMDLPLSYHLRTNLRIHRFIGTQNPMYFESVPVNADAFISCRPVDGRKRINHIEVEAHK
jgi:hypothetical protein